jgi:hypothetical protein
VVQDVYQSYQKNREKEKQEEEERKKNEEAKQRRDELINQYGHKKGDELFTHELRLEKELQEMEREDFENKRAADRAKDPFAPIDKALSGVFVSLGRGLGQGMKDVIEAIKSGAETAFVKTAGKLAAAGVDWLIGGAAALGKSAKDAVSGWMSDEEESQDSKKTKVEIVNQTQPELNEQASIDKMTDIDYFKGIIAERGGTWNKKGVNIIGIRDDSVASGKNKYDDMFLVIVDGELKGVFGGSTDPGRDEYVYNGKKSADMGGTFHMAEGSYDFQYFEGSKTSRSDKYNDTLRPVKEIKGYRDQNANGKIDMGTSESDLKSAGYNIWFHYGGETNKNVNKMSLGCQVIAGDKYWDASKNKIINDYGKIRYENGNRQGAYNDFLRFVKSGVTDNNRIKYNLIHNSRINTNIYSKYRNKLNGAR